ncbi:MAG: hypothetical protein HYW91_00030 [Candidatus Sungbacteria bacterium]|nr:hypothetical protein [Candidatus Sungbacteria bacterium]
MAQTPMDEQAKGKKEVDTRDGNRQGAVWSVRRYIERMWAYYGSLKVKSISWKDEMIDCPRCYRQSMKYHERWKCVTLDCGTVLPDEFAPPGPRELEKMFVFMREEMERERLLALSLRVGATLSFTDDPQGHKFIG